MNGFESSPAIGADGTVYAVGESFVYAVTPTGTLKWKTQITAVRPYKSPILSADGTVYVGTAGARLYALESDGGIRWVHELESEAGDSGAIGVDDTIYISGGQLYAFSPVGTTIWASVDFARALPAVSASGTVYARGSADRELFALGHFGVPLWHTVRDADQNSLTTTPTIAADGTLYYTTSNGLWAINPAGEILWHFDSGYTLPATSLAQYSPVLAPDGTLYAVFGLTLHAIVGNTNRPAVSPWSMYRGNAQHTGRSQRPFLQHPRKRPDGNVEFQVISQVGAPLTIEKSMDFRAWTSMTHLVPLSVPEKVVDLTATNTPMGFYRAVGG